MKWFSEGIGLLISICTLIGLVASALIWVTAKFATKSDVIDVAIPMTENRERILNLEKAGPHDPERRATEEWKRRLQQRKFDD